VEKVFVGRQPIYRDGIEVFAYELLSRNSELNRAAFTDGDKATAQLLLNTFIDIGLDQVVGSNLAFVNVTRNFVLSEYCSALPKDRVVLEVGAAVDPPLFEALSRLSKAGYSIALDNFFYEDHLQPLVDVADIVKLDVQALDRETIAEQADALRGFKKKKLLAQKVETHEDYEYCKNLGFDYYQGYFFCKPQVVSQTTIPANRLSTLHMLARLQDPKISIEELEHAVGQDIAVSYRILRYLNSPIQALPRKVDSIRHAITMVGTGLISTWASLILMEAIEDKPRELMVTAMVRAHMCQQLGTAMYQRNVDQFFTVGLLSMIDAMTDRPMNEALEVLPLIDEVKNALLQQDGLMAAALDCVRAYERCDWDHTSCPNLDEAKIREAYLRAVTWARSVTQELVS
jgi:EAL and modified HD-GYP domain-containing signal transduction protein